jgi:hypothetical protein
MTPATKASIQRFESARRLHSLHFHPLSAFVASAWLVLGCALDQGQPIRTYGYRAIDERTISIESVTGACAETWASVSETPTAVIVEARRRNVTGDCSGVGAGVEIWLTLHLQAPLGEREVIDALTRAPFAAEAPRGR